MSKFRPDIILENERLQEQMENELKPCPFCGGKAGEVWDYHDNDWYSIVCEDCSANISRKENKDAIKAWNTRSDNGKS